MNISLHVRELYTASSVCMVVIVVIKSNIRLVTPNIIDAAKKKYRNKMPLYNEEQVYGECNTTTTTFCLNKTTTRTKRAI